LEHWRAGKRVVGLTLDHQNNADGVIGKMIDAEDSAYGLKVTFAFSSTAKAQEARTKAREGILNGLSFFGPIIDRGFTNFAGKSISVLKEVGLWFVGLTPVPSNAGSLVLAAKTADGEPADVKAGAALPDAWVSDMRSALTISSPIAQKAAVDTLVADMYGAASTVGDPVDESAPDGADGNETQHEDPAASYALSIIGESGPDTSPPGGEPVEPLADQLLASIDAANTRTELAAFAAELEALKGEPA
jgi:HK97 family phage prohead protease